jgi:hypothetical protein
VSSSIGDGLGRSGGPGPCFLLRKVAPRADAKESRKWLSPGNYVVRDLPMVQSTNIAVDWQRRKSRSTRELESLIGRKEKRAYL